jgi:hypothetical protein
VAERKPQGGARVASRSNQIIVCQIAKPAIPPNQKALENIAAFKGFRWLRGPATTETDIF